MKKRLIISSVFLACFMAAEAGGDKLKLTGAYKNVEYFSLKDQYFKVGRRMILSDNRVKDRDKHEKPRLDSLAKIMEKYPGMVIEIAVHLDCKEDPELEKRLSLEQAKQRKHRMISRGIAGGRIQPRGYATDEKMYKCNNCEKCPLEAQRRNHRVEIIIKKLQ